MEAIATRLEAIAFICPLPVGGDVEEVTLGSMSAFRQVVTVRKIQAVPESNMA